MNFTDIALHVPEILLPSADVDLSKWAVNACDQYTSQPDYWQRTEQLVGSHPSTLRLILPEVWLGKPDREQRFAAIAATMKLYLANGTLGKRAHGFIRVERTLRDSSVRRGLMVGLDLESYDYRPESTSLIRATEGTVVERLPPRARIREQAAIEVPHVMVLIDDPERSVIEPLFDRPASELYDVTLMHGAGRVRGHLVDTPDDIGAVTAALRALAAPDQFAARYAVGTQPPLLYAMGDGNHSFATAKLVWERVRETLPPESRASHPARYALVELVNIHDSGLVFEPIHRIVSGANPQKLLDSMQAFFSRGGNRCVISGDSATPARTTPAGSVQRIEYVTARERGVIDIEGARSNLPVGSLQSFLDSAEEFGHRCDIDYIHGDDALRSLASRADTVGFLLPVISKHDLFKTIILDHTLPRKSFSMGSADDKRFYLECRAITP